MENEPNAQNTERDARTVEGPSGPPPDEGLPYDSEMTDADEANAPPESDADPKDSPPPQGA